MLLHRSKCSSSSFYKKSAQADTFSCKHIFDEDASTSWVTDHEGVGAWVDVQFYQTIWLTGIKYQHYKHDSVGNFKNVLFQFSDGLNLTSILADDDKYILNLELKYPKLTSSLHITAESVYPQQNNDTEMRYGIAELLLYGCAGKSVLIVRFVFLHYINKNIEFCKVIGECYSYLLFQRLIIQNIA